jgi:hypothetical protein
MKLSAIVTAYLLCGCVAGQQAGDGDTKRPCKIVFDGAYVLFTCTESIYIEGQCMTFHASSMDSTTHLEVIVNLRRIDVRCGSTMHVDSDDVQVLVSRRTPPCIASSGKIVVECERRDGLMTWRGNGTCELNDGQHVFEFKYIGN